MQRYLYVLEGVTHHGDEHVDEDDDDGHVVHEVVTWYTANSNSPTDSTMLVAPSPAGASDECDECETLLVTSVVCRRAS